MRVINKATVETYFAGHAGHQGIRAARKQYDAWLAITEVQTWSTPEDVKKAHPKASIRKSGRVVFNIKGNDFRLILVIAYKEGLASIRFFGTHEEYDDVNAETI